MGKDQSIKRHADFASDPVARHAENVRRAAERYAKDGDEGLASAKALKDAADWIETVGAKRARRVRA